MVGPGGSDYVNLLNIASGIGKGIHYGLCPGSLVAPGIATIPHPFAEGGAAVLELYGAAACEVP